MFGHFHIKHNTNLLSHKLITLAITMANNYKHPIITLATMGILLLGFAPRADAAMTCNVVIQSLYPCVGYFQGGGVGLVPYGCCNGIRNLNKKAQTTPDRQAVCKCLKDTANALKNLNIGLAASIPSKCGVNLSYKLDPSIDCTKIH